MSVTTAKPIRTSQIKIVGYLVATALSLYYVFALQRYQSSPPPLISQHNANTPMDASGPDGHNSERGEKNTLPIDLGAPPKKKKSDIDEATHQRRIEEVDEPIQSTRNEVKSKPIEKYPVGFSPTLPRADDPRVAHMAALLGIDSWPPEELVWNVTEHGGRAKPLYMSEDTIVEPYKHPRIGGKQGQRQEEQEADIYNLPVSLANRSTIVDAFKAEALLKGIKLSVIDSAISCALKSDYNRFSRDSTWHRTEEDRKAAEGIRMHIGILSTPLFILNRLIPNLQTSLVNVASVDVFIRKTPISHHFVRYIIRHIGRSHPNPSSIRVVELYGPGTPPNENPGRNLYVRNAWMNLEMLHFWRAEALGIDPTTVGIAHSVDHCVYLVEPENRGKLGRSAPPVQSSDGSPIQWFIMGDDDSYVLTDSYKALALDVMRAARRDEAHFRASAKEMLNLTHLGVAGKDNQMPPLVVGHLHGFIQVMRDAEGNARQIEFAHGGPSFMFNREAFDLTTMPFLQRCEEAYEIPGGDQILSFCLRDAGAKLRDLGHMLYSPAYLMEDRRFRKVPFPVGFHEHRNQSMFDRMFALESLRRARNELVSVDDIIENMDSSKQGLGPFLWEKLSKCLTIAKM